MQRNKLVILKHCQTFGSIEIESNFNKKKQNAPLSASTTATKSIPKSAFLFRIMTGTLETTKVITSMF